MVVQHNLTAMNANRMLGSHNRTAGKIYREAYLLVTESTVQQMMQQVFLFLRK